jgi:D-glycerate 3-kinase
MNRDRITQPGYVEDVVAAVAALGGAGTNGQTVIGISGLQGSGKSTLAARIVAAATRNGRNALALSIDDFYLGRAARARLARDVHPLLATRGVPGTHDVGLLLRTLDDLRNASVARPMLVPRFDKGLDTRLPPSRWRRIGAAPDLVIVEGWCIGVPPQPRAALLRPVNRLERDEDAAARWRGWVNDQLAQSYVPLWQRLDRLVLLQPPAYSVVRRWRDEQEQALRKRRAPRALTPAALQRFLMHYERLSRHALQTLPALADLRVVLDAQRRVRRIVGGA